MNAKKKKPFDVKKANKDAAKATRQFRRRARLNHQNPLSGKPTRPAKKQGCLSISAVLVLSAGGAVTGIVLAARGLA